MKYVSQRVVLLFLFISVIIDFLPHPKVTHIDTVTAASLEDKSTTLDIIAKPLALTATAAFAVNEQGDLQTWGIANPPQLTNVVSISASQTHGVAIHRDGHVSGWGAVLPPPALVKQALPD